MTDFEIYVLILCLIVFLLLTSLLWAMLVVLLKQGYKLIKYGHEDERIKIEYQKESKSKLGSKIGCMSLTIIMMALILASCCFSMYVQFSEDRVSGDFPVPKVVLSDSMSIKHRNNEYLEENELDDQFQQFDLILTHKLPDEFDLKLFDIVVYESENGLVIHRIVNIEEPNTAHPNERYFRLRGDANKYSDSYPVKYSQMRAIYRGDRIPFIGNIILFLQAPAGWLCILLVLFGQFVTPFVEKKLLHEIEMRLQTVGATNKKLPTEYKVQPILISHFRLSLKLQRKDPKVDLRISEKRGGLKITVRKGPQKK